MKSLVQLIHANKKEKRKCHNETNYFMLVKSKRFIQTEEKPVKLFYINIC
jgi:hypothetical protein